VSRVAAGSVDTVADGVVEVVLGGHGMTTRGGVARPPGSGSPREMRAELAKESAFGVAGIAIEDGDFARRKPAGRETVQPFRGDLTQCHERTQPISTIAGGFGAGGGATGTPGSALDAPRARADCSSTSLGVLTLTASRCDLTRSPTHTWMNVFLAQPVLVVLLERPPARHVRHRGQSQDRMLTSPDARS
jgi:hypothetical protein